MRPVACMLACFAQTSHSWRAPSSAEEVHVEEISEEPALAYHSNAHWRAAQGRQALAVFFHSLSPGAAWSPFASGVGSVGSNFNVLPNSARANQIYAADEIPTFEEEYGFKLEDADERTQQNLMNDRRVRYQTFQAALKQSEVDGALDQIKVDGRLEKQLKTDKMRSLKARSSARARSRRQGPAVDAQILQQDEPDEKKETKLSSHNLGAAFLENDHLKRSSVGGSNWIGGGVRRAKYGMAKRSKNMDEGLANVEEFVPDQPAELMTVAELKQVLKDTGQKVTGLKKDLIERVKDMQRSKLLGMPVKNSYAYTDLRMKWYMLTVTATFEKRVLEQLNKMIQEGFDDQIEAAWVAMPEFASSASTNLNPGIVWIRCVLSPGLYKTITELAYVTDFFGYDPQQVHKSVGKDGKRSQLIPVSVSDQEFDTVYLQTRADPSRPYEKIYKPLGKDGKQVEMEDHDKAEAFLLRPEKPVAKKPKKATQEAQALAGVFVKGEMLEVIEGPFTGMCGPVLSDAKEEFAISLTIMGRESPVKISPSDCRKVA